MTVEQDSGYIPTEQDLQIINEWPMMSSWFPVFPTLITLGYLCFIYIIGPRYMKSRPPYQLKKFILFYNIFQIIANAWLVKEHIRAGWLIKYGFICPILDDLDIQMMKNILWWVLQLKIIDYVETCLFVLRKKRSQVSNLHVFHHISNLMFAWFGLRHFPEMRATFCTLINCFIHVIMYIYYLLAACSPKIQRMIAPIKPYITIIQMVQFLVMLIFISQSRDPHCNVRGNHKLAIYMFGVNLLIYLFLFYDFYRKSYVKTSKQKT